MNKEITAILGMGAALLISNWMIWSNINTRIDTLDARVNAQLVELGSRVGRIEGMLIAQGELQASTTAAAAPSDPQ